ncbi:MAG TPA: AAA family ATPase, partial [Planctomycetaceae bacterium]|nr:AAA family ATPase [Planctomycetaceae bacterium]
MANTEDKPDKVPAEAAAPTLEHGTYEVIRNRLSASGRELQARLAKLNEARREAFGAIETSLLGTGRITTDNNCVPRDLIAIDSRFLFGYNVHIGLRSTTAPADVFSVWQFADKTFTQQPLDLIADATFERDFVELYKYYRRAVFARFVEIGPYLYMVFRISDDVRDIKAFKWLVQGDRLQYVDNRSEHEVVLPAQHEFEWTRTRRDMQVGGLHAHFNIADRLFVETTEGDLTVKIENNTDTGEGIYAEPVDNPDQTLDDAEIFYATLGNLILLKIRPYQEPRFRYLVYSEKTQQVRRLDSIEHACVLLPDDQGIIVSNGYFLQTGECKIFESALSEMVYHSRVQSPNGEDYLYVFYNRLSGDYVLLPYNLIEQKVGTPILCNGFTLFDSGEMVYFKAGEEPQRHHALQIWQTPYTAEDYQVPAKTQTYLHRIGNRDIVRGMAECHEVLGLIAKEDTYANLFVDLAKTTGDILDSYHWIGHGEVFNLAEVLRQIKDSAEAAIGEFEKVRAVRRDTADELTRVTTQTRKIVSAIRARRFEQIDDFVKSLVDLRGVRGEIIALRDRRYIDLDSVGSLEAEVEQNSHQVAENCVGFLLRPEALSPYEATVAEHRGKIDGLTKATDARALEKDIAQAAAELEMLIDVVSNLKIDDATQRTTIIDNISTIFAQLNQTRAALKTKMGTLGRGEAVAEFASQLKLLNQGVVNYLDVCDTPERCDEYLTKMMVQIEEMEGRFADYDEFVGQLTEKREEVYGAFEARKQQLVEARSRRAAALAQAAERILRGIKTRVESLKEVNEIHGYFASDLMIEKVRDIVEQLSGLGDAVRVDDIQSRLKTIREDAVRQLKDRKDLYEDGEKIIRLGTHRFSVNTQPFDLTTVVRDGDMYLHLTGTNFFEKIDDPELLATRDVWGQEFVSENDNVYRGEYLAFEIFRSRGSTDVPEAEQLRSMNDDEFIAFVQRFMGPRFAEGYVKGVHDHDAAILLRAILDMDATVGLLRYHPRARALAQVFWMQYADGRAKRTAAAAMKGFGAIREVFPATEQQRHYIADMRRLVGDYVGGGAIFDPELVDEAGEYLFEELTRGGQFVVSRRAAGLFRDFHAHLDQKLRAERFRESLA